METKLQIGDIVRKKGDPSYANYVVSYKKDGVVAAARVVNIENPEEWELVYRAEYTNIEERF